MAKQSIQTKPLMESNNIIQNNINTTEPVSVSDKTVPINDIVEESLVVNISATTNNQEPEKKKRGRKKNVIVQQTLTATNDGLSSAEDSAIIPEKKIRKRRSKKEKIDGAPKKESETSLNDSVSPDDIQTVPLIKKRKRRMCKNKTNNETVLNHGCENIVIDNNNDDGHKGDSLTTTNVQTQPEEKVIKKRGRKPKGGKITTHQLEDNSVNNEMPNIILHLKCSLSNIKNSADDEYNIQSYNSGQIHGSEINIKKMIIEHEEEKKNAKNITEGNISCKNILHDQTIATVPNSTSTTSIVNIRPFNEVLNNNTSSSLFQVYDPIIPLSNQGDQPNNNTNFTISNDTSPYTKPQTSHTFLNTVYSSDINSYSNDYDDSDDALYSSKNEREIWKKINQLKLSFHKSDICNNMGGTQRSACFWCTCEFDSPAIYIPKSLSKDVYNVYGCFCSPECAAAFLMNENVDTSTRFERYHLLNSLYGKIYKYEKSIKIAPNPFYLLNKYYGNLTIQEYRKLFQSDQMIYVVNKPLTHILPELYEDNNDFLLNSKIIPTNTVNIKKNKPLKSNILNNAFGIN
jgi:hypothetical protein